MLKLCYILRIKFFAPRTLTMSQTRHIGTPLPKCQEEDTNKNLLDNCPFYRIVDVYLIVGYILLLLLVSIIGQLRNHKVSCNQMWQK